MEYKIFDNLPQEAKYIRTAVLLTSRALKTNLTKLMTPQSTF